MFLRMGLIGPAGNSPKQPESGCRLAAMKFSRIPSSGWCPRLGYAKTGCLLPNATSCTSVLLTNTRRYKQGLTGRPSRY